MKCEMYTFSIPIAVYFLYSIACTKSIHIFRKGRVLDTRSDLGKLCILFINTLKFDTEVLLSCLVFPTLRATRAMAKEKHKSKQTNKQTNKQKQTNNLSRVNDLKIS